jgi:alanyl-tRNA synthetase
LTQDELREVELLVNRQILSNTEVKTEVMDLEGALSTGAMALFGEKYGEKVRVVTIPGFSRELCGGTHVYRTGDIGLFKIVEEVSSAAGVRRIEGVTGEGALERFQESTAQLARAGKILNTSTSGVLEQLEKSLEHQRELEQQLDSVKERLAHQQAANLTIRVVKNVTVIVDKVDGLDSKQLRTIADSVRNKYGSAIIVIASVNDSKASVISAVTKDLTDKVQAGKLVGEVSKAIGGKGGGRPDLAEGAGKDIAQLPSALAAVYAKVETLLQA